MRNLRIAVAALAIFAPCVAFAQTAIKPLPQGELDRTSGEICREVTDLSERISVYQQILDQQQAMAAKTAADKEAADKAASDKAAADKATADKAPVGNVPVVPSSTVTGVLTTQGTKPN